MVSPKIDVLKNSRGYAIRQEWISDKQQHENCWYGLDSGSGTGNAAQKWTGNTSVAVAGS